MTGRPRRAAMGLLLVVLAQTPARPEDGAARVVRYANDALTVRLSRASVNEVLDEIARQTGAEIRGQSMDSREVSADFEAVPLPEALDRLLGSQNFTLIYGENGNLRAVQLLGEARNPAPRPPETPITSDNRRYLTAKASRAGHQLRHVMASLTEESEGTEEPGLVP